jgi:hypothetical protein
MVTEYSNNTNYYKPRLRAGFFIPISFPEKGISTLENA